METALAIVLDDAAPFDAIRRDHAVATFAHGIPFHITLLYPFVPAEEVTEELLENVRSFFTAQQAFDFALTRVAMWPDVVYAVPEPDDMLRSCMRALFDRFPEYPPYGGRHLEVVPHATLGEEVDAAQVFGEIERRARPHLPKRYRVDDAALLEEFAPARWRERERFPFGR